MLQQTITLDIVSDIACPWCYVGKKRLEKAISLWNGAPVEVNWHPFELDPNLPEEGLDLTAYLDKKFGTRSQTKEMTDRLTALGKEEGITFSFGAPMKAVPTFRLHKLLHAARKEGFMDVLKERLLHAYFTENLHLNEEKVLAVIMESFGWDPEKTEDVLNDYEIGKSVRAEIMHYQQKGVSGVPFFIVNNTYGISGAQPTSVFLDVFAQLAPKEEVSDASNCDMVKGYC